MSEGLRTRTVPDIQKMSAKSVGKAFQKHTFYLCELSPILKENSLEKALKAVEGK